MDINHLGLTPERAKQLFSLTVGPLPGVSLDGLTRDPNEFDGTQAVIYLLNEWRALTPEQRIAAATSDLRSAGARARRTLRRALARRLGDAPAARRARELRRARPRTTFPRTTTRRSRSTRTTRSRSSSACPPFRISSTCRWKVRSAPSTRHSTSWAEPLENDPNTGDFKRFPDGKCHTILWNEQVRRARRPCPRRRSSRTS